MTRFGTILAAQSVGFVVGTRILFI